LFLFFNVFMMEFFLRRVLQVGKECESLREQLNLVMQRSLHNGTMEQELLTERQTVQQLRAQLAEAHITDNHQHAHEHEENEMRSSSSDHQHEQQHNEEMAQLRAEITRLEEALKETRVTQRRATSENEELHRIMQQNAEDENQNTIHVELQHALDRITALSTENERLRLTAEESHSGHVSPTQGGADDRSSVCSEHGDKQRERFQSITLRGRAPKLTVLTLQAYLRKIRALFF
jgi:hypothetical protein